MLPRPVTLSLASGSSGAWLTDLADAADRAAGKIERGVALAEKVAPSLPQPGQGATTLRWAALATVAAVDLGTARVLESHADALAIIAESGEEQPTGAWGVYAAEAPGVQLSARKAGDAWLLSGTKPWCSLAELLDAALVTATVEPEVGRDENGSGPQRQLFAVDLHAPTVTMDAGPAWIARGLRDVPSRPVTFADTAADPVGEPGWYLDRDGFAWGGLGVAACWYGGAVAVLGRLRRHAAERGGDLALRSLGAADAALHGARAALNEAAGIVDSGAAAGPAGATLAVRVRSVVASAVETTLTEAAHALGPAPLAFEEEHAKRVVDLAMYVRQHHADRDLARLGRDCLGEQQ